MRAGIRGLTFHDLRGTAVVTPARAECNEAQIYSITGHRVAVRTSDSERHCSIETASMCLISTRIRGSLSRTFPVAALRPTSQASVIMRPR
jgi:hypothetical protein